jgi:hypothetical protein
MPQDPADESRIFPVSGYTLYVRDLSHGSGLDIGLGTQFDRPDSLDRYYGDDLGYAFQFLSAHSPVSAYSRGA